MMLLVLGLACWAARAAPTSLSGLESVLQQCCEQEVMGACRVGGFFPESPATWAPVSFTADERFIANDVTIRQAVSHWDSDPAAAEAAYGHISSWETGGVTDMAWLFCVRADWMEGFAQDIPEAPFYSIASIQPKYRDRCVLSSSFNEDISAWDTSAVTTMAAMFHGAWSFDQPLVTWQTDKVKDMEGMFYKASAFNQLIDDWRVDNVDMMLAMFDGASSFNQPIGDWRPARVTDMSAMFKGASSFNQPLGGWSIDSVHYMFEMFRDASSFNQDLGEWQVGKVDGMRGMFSGASLFDQDLGWCVDNDIDVRFPHWAFNGTLCNSTSCGVNQPSTCQKHSKNRSAKEARKQRNIAIIIGSVLFAGLLLLGCALGIYRRKRKELELERSEIVQEQVTAARDQVKEFQAHFATISGSRLMKFDRLRPHEECRRGDELIIYDLVADVRDASTRGEIFIFFSHQWLGWSEPDPKRIHIKAMQQAVRAVSKDLDTPLEKIRVWVDYVSIPQKNHRERALAIASLPTFASVSDMFVVIAPNASHADACYPCDSRTYRQRAWCRAEMFACWARNGVSDMYFNTNAGLKPLVVNDESTRNAVRREALDVMNGEFTCCRLGHPRGEPCDREALMLPLLGLYADIYAERHGKHAEAYAFIEPVKDSLFPETFEYVHKGLDGVETTTTQVLFGDLIAAVEDESARTKDFKPGTNAQRHRFYHIHQHGRNSSRLTDLIRSSFRRVNVSGVDDKEPAASEEPVTAPPTARRQLTWRASAPGDYGTIE